MSKTPKKGTRRTRTKGHAFVRPVTKDFDDVLRLIDAARTCAFAAVNHELVGLYWQIGEFISRKLESAAWGEGVVQELAEHIARRTPSSEASLDVTSFA